MKVFNSKNRNIVKLSIRESDFTAINSLLQRFNTGEDVLKLLKDVRVVLGKVSSHLNLVSEIYKRGMKGADIRVDLQPIMADLQHLEELHQKVLELNSMATDAVSFACSFYKEGNSGEYSAENISNLKNLLQVINHLSHYIGNISFNQQQIDKMTYLLQNTNQQQMIEEVDVYKMNVFLSSAVYSMPQERDKTRKIVREILQNSCDAIIKSGVENGQVEFITSNFGNNSMDLIARDNGIGMDWTTLSQKFFIYFASGKEDSPESTGGFGIAKGIIQETPREGWSIETNGIHSGRFQKNMYVVDPVNYHHPASKLIPSTTSGVTLALYDIPFLHESSIYDLAKKYCSLSRILITINGRKVAPLFNLDQLKKIDSANDIATTIGKNEMEKDAILNGFAKQDARSHINFGSLSFEGEGTQTTIDFYLSKNDGTGNFYIFLNGQYQFENRSYDYIKGFNIICFITTNSRPQDIRYPLDPGRANLKEPYKSQVDEIERNIVETYNRVLESEIFKDGLNITMINEDKEEMDFDSMDFPVSGQISVLERAMEAASSLWTGENHSPESKVQLVKNTFEEMNREEVNQPPMDEVQQQIVDTAIEQLVQDQEKNIDWHERARETMETVNTKCAFVIQKNFVSENSALLKKRSVATLTNVWSQVLRHLSKKLRKSRYGSSMRGKKVVPGIIYSDEAIGLMMPPKAERYFYTVLINPLSSANVVSPDLFEALINLSSEEIRPSPADDETPINRFTNFIYHIAIHELTHVMYPSSYGDLEEWHKAVTAVEIMCHFDIEKVRSIVKSYMPALKKEMREVISMVRKDKKKSMQENAGKRVFNLYKMSKLND